MYPWRAGETITAEKLTAGIQRGSVGIVANTTIQPSGSSSHFAGAYLRGSVDIVFDVPFAEVPTVSVTARTTVPGTVIEVAASNVTTTGMTVYSARNNVTNTVIDWMAIGRPAL